MDPGHAASSVRAQAIAARTYAYYQINIYGTLNNSNQRQVYIPYRYDGLSTAHKAVIDQALTGQVYLSLPGITDPIAAFFSDDNDVWTDQGGTSYLKSVYDCQFSPYNVPAVFTNVVPGVFGNTVPVVFTPHVPPG
jgi:peptidoglycan hydrolase-like amidase